MGGKTHSEGAGAVDVIRCRRLCRFTILIYTDRDATSCKVGRKCEIAGSSVLLDHEAVRRRRAAEVVVDGSGRGRGCTDRRCAQVQTVQVDLDNVDDLV